MRPEICRVQAAILRAEDVEGQYKLDREAAREELKLATRALADISNQSDRVATVIWAAENTRAPKNDLAWVIFSKEHQEFHLRKLVRGAHRNCQKCGAKVCAGNRFEQRSFYCVPCEAAVYADQQRTSNERERLWQAKDAARKKRLSELKSQSGLSDTDAKELAALMISQVDGSVSQLAEFIFEGQSRQGSVDGDR